MLVIILKNGDNYFFYVKNTILNKKNHMKKYYKLFKYSFKLKNNIYFDRIMTDYYLIV